MSDRPAPDISVIIATHNRAAGIRETLEAMSRLDSDGIAVEWIVIDNNSTDETAEVIKRFADSLPLHHLFEPRPNKNLALNRALVEVPLGELVVFTDDDVSPDAHWLQAIHASGKEWPEHNVFGGSIRIGWPGDGTAPDFARTEWMRRWGYGEHNRGDSAKPYEGYDHPYGPNFWVRRVIFDRGTLYDERLADDLQHPTMGSESSFLLTLLNDGEEIIYYPRAGVEHRIALQAIEANSIVSRAFNRGRAIPRLSYLSGSPFVREPRWLMWFKYLVLYGYHWLRFRLSGLLFRRPRSVEAQCGSMIQIGAMHESLRMLSEPPSGNPA